ncbi:MAG: glycosyltransferase, partial [Candidatus Sumerlaeota bacterium]|nr:glycosyltransferase [Candidatus Sumerlaeota bacterium]
MNAAGAAPRFACAIARFCAPQGRRSKTERFLEAPASSPACFDPKTEEVLRRHPSRGLRWLRWEGRGSYAEARNRLARAARGAKVAFLDDDCVPAPDWLERIDGALERLDAVGGMVAPGSSLEFPPWWDPEMAWLAGLSVPGHLGPFAGSLYYPQTANLALRRTVLEREPFQELGGQFVQGAEVYTLGREDAELWRRLRRKGYAVAFDPALMVYHHIPRERLEWKALLDRARRDGRAYARREMNRAALEGAWRDAAYAPLVLLRDWLWHPWPNDPQRTLDRLWIARQRAFLRAFRENAGLDDLHGWKRARRAAIAHVFISEIKRPLGRIKTAWHRRFGPQPIEDLPPRRMLVVSAGYLGDAILLAPVLKAWRGANPQTAVDVALTSASGAALLDGQGLADRVVRIDPKGRDGAARLDRAIREGGYDLIL